MPSATPSHLSDEDFINKSLLASLDAQADAEPVHTDDDSHDDESNIARYAHPRHHAHPAPDEQQDQYASFHPLHASDNLFSMHTGLYSSQAQHIHQEYSAEYLHHPHHPSGAQQAQGAALKLNGFPGASNYRNSFTSYPNTTRARHQVSQSVLTAASSYREQGPAFYPTQDAFPGQITSPVMQQYGSYDYPPHSQQPHQQLHQQQQQPHHQQQQQPVVNGVHKSPYLIDPYAASSKPSAQQQQQQPAPSQGQPYSFSNGIGVQLSSQTPYGPHVPAGASIGAPSTNPINVSNASIPAGLSASVSLGMANGNGPTTTANGEEISTIFVVGFPEDMQEREFQNMFTFSPGFEAATLKIPHKEYNAYNPLLGGSAAANGIGGATGAQGATRGYGAANDPYNLVTVNQGGVVVDAGRDGMTSWPAPPQGEDLASHYAMGGMVINTLNPLNALNPISSLSSLNSLNPLSSQAQAQAAQNALSLALPPRKQIIGFAKFRSREEALVARDVLQGRRVDIEKGAVLKAEMAKKNLHTKRGVGLVGGVGQVGTVGQQGPGPHSAGGALDNLAFGAPESGLARIGQWSRENGPSLSAGQPSIAASSLANSHSLDGLTVNALSAKDSSSSSTSVAPTDEESRKRDSLVGAMSLANLGGNTIGGSIRGAREREEDERRRRGEREREINLMRLRASNSAAFDAFHGVPTPSTVNGTSVTSVTANGSNAAAMSRQSSGTSSSSLWGSPAVTSATVATTADSPSQQGQVYDNPRLTTADPHTQDLHDSLHDDDGADDHNVHHQQLLEEEEEEFERQQMEQERKEEEEAMHREYQEQLQQQQHAQTQAQQQTSEDVTVGPWDRIHSVASYAAVARPSYLVVGGNASSTMSATANAHSQAQPSSSSERSTSPGGFLDAHHGPGQSQGQGGYIPQFQHLHEQQKQLQLQRQSQQFGQQPAPNQGYRTQSESSETSAIDVAAVSNPAGYVGAAPMRPLGVHTNGILERLQQHASSSSSSTSASASTSTSTSASALASGSTSAFASSVSSTSSTSAGTPSGSANGNGGGVSPLPPGGSNGSASANTSAPGSAGNTSPQLPSPAGSGGSASTTSLRGTVDQNPPINTLYVGNLPTSPPPLGYPNDYLEETLREVFSARPGYRKLCFRHKANGPMCFVEFEDVQYAAKALVEMSGNTLRGAVKNGIRLSYSKNPLGVRTSNSGSGQTSTTSGSSTPSQAQQFAQVLNNTNQYQHGQGHGQGPQPPAGSESFLSRATDDFGGHQHNRLPTSILRRDSTLSPTSPTYMGAGNGNGNQPNFFSSPPPRFYGAGSPTGTTQLTGASTAFVPRSAAAAVNGSGMFAAYGGGGFSPFGMPFGSNEAQNSFNATMIHQHQSYAQHSEGQHPQQQHADE